MARNTPYRSIPLHLTKDERFRELSLEAKGLFLTIALHCDKTGLARFSPGVLAIEANAASPDALSQLLEELQSAEWIVTDGNAVFIPDLLGWSPNFTPANENHRPGVENAVHSIRSAKLVEAFWNRYPEWRSAVPAERPTSPTRVAASKDGMGDGNGMGGGTHHDGPGIPSRTASDPETGAEANYRTKTDSSRETPPTSIEYARALASRLDTAQGQNGSKARKLKPVRADAVAATELQQAGVPLTFALEVAADVGLNYRPDAGSEQILSTRYANQAILERWRMAGLGNGALQIGGVQRRRGFADAAQLAEDVASNKDPKVHATVRQYIARLETKSPGAGDRWLEEMNASKPPGGYVYPFAFRWIKANAPAFIAIERAVADEAQRA